MVLALQEKREYQKNWINQRRLEWIEANGPCPCGSTEELEVDHIDPTTKKYNPSQIWSRNQAARNEELSKCQVLCSTCHLEKTLRERDKPEHGSQSMYKNGCHCPPCTEAHRVHNAQYR